MKNNGTPGYPESACIQPKILILTDILTIRKQLIEAAQRLKAAPAVRSGSMTARLSNGELPDLVVFDLDNAKTCILEMVDFLKDLRKKKTSGVRVAAIGKKNLSPVEKRFLKNRQIRYYKKPLGMSELKEALQKQDCPAK